MAVLKYNGEYISGSGEISMKLTQAQYDALSEGQKNNGTTYFVETEDDNWDGKNIKYNDTQSVTGAIDSLNDTTLKKVASGTVNIDITTQVSNVSGIYYGRAKATIHNVSLDISKHKVFCNVGNDTTCIVQGWVFDSTQIVLQANRFGSTASSVPFNYVVVE